MSRLVYPFEDEYVTDAPTKLTSITTLGGVLGLAQTEERPDEMQTLMEEMRKQSAQIAEMQAKVVEQLQQINEDTQRLKEITAKEQLRIEKWLQRRSAEKAYLKACDEALDDWLL